MLRLLASLICLVITLTACAMSTPSVIDATVTATESLAAATAQPTRTTNATTPSAPAITTANLVENCASAPRIRLIIQERGRVTDVNDERLNIRSGPGTDYGVIGFIEPGDIFFVLDGPECAEIFSWFRVRHAARVGWIAEGDPEQYYVEPYLPG